MTQKADVAQLKARLGEYVRQVKSGAEIVITERGVPVARLVPLDPDERRASREQRLIRSGILRPAALRAAWTAMRSTTSTKFA